MQTGNAYTIRIISVYATHWRRSGADVGGSPVDLIRGERFRRFYELFTDQLPAVLVHEPDLHSDAVGIHFDKDVGAPMASAELLIFALPFPADQVVAALVLDFESADLNIGPELARSVLSNCANATVRIGSERLGDYVDRLAENVAASKEVAPGPAQRGADLPLERHHLVFINDLAGAAAPDDNVVTQILYDINPPYRKAFVTLERPDGLNQEEQAFAAVSPATSFFYGQPDDVEGSVFLTAVQAVGTASRFQQIWQAAYYQVQQFQSNKQAKQSGVQQRKDLEMLADEMGNLELDLAFSVETAADLGLRMPSSRLDDFHEALYDVMQISRRAHTVSQMFVRLGGSIRSELTAIESRERQQEDKRRLNGAIALGLLSFLVAPLGFLLGFFGMNAREVHSDSSMWNWPYYHWVYIAAAVVALIPLLVLATLHGRSPLARTRAHAESQPPAPPAAETTVAPAASAALR
jgi:hypothetical protein